MLENVVKLTNRGMITIPASLRKKYGLHDGNHVMIVEDEGTLKIILIESIKNLQKRSVTTKEMIKNLERSREEELELEE